MKAIDPTIKIGAVLAAPGNWPDGQSPDWNSNVLAQCGSAIDFVIVHWYPQNPGYESDSGLLAAPQNGTTGIAAMATKLKSLISQYGGAKAANIQILVTETNSVSSNPGKQTLSIVNAMFVADDMLSWVENGAANVDVWDLHNGAVAGNTSSSLLRLGDLWRLRHSVECNVGRARRRYAVPDLLRHADGVAGRQGRRHAGLRVVEQQSVDHARGRGRRTAAWRSCFINKDPKNTISAICVALGLHVPRGPERFIPTRLPATRHIQQCQRPGDSLLDRDAALFV